MKIKTGFLLPIVCIPLLMFFASYFVSPVISTLTNGQGVCSFISGSGSINRCQWKKFDLTILVSFVISAIVVLSSRKFFHKIGAFTDYVYSIGYIIFIFPVNMAIYNAVVSILRIPYGNARGAFNNILFPVLLIVNLVVLAFMLIDTRKGMKKADKMQK